MRKLGPLMWLLSVALAVGCGCDEFPDVRDAGRDADAGQDAGGDAGVDAGPRDAGRDGGGAEIVWRRIEDLPEPCPVWVAEDPSAALPPLRFEPCPGIEGCRQVVVDWPDLPEPDSGRPRFGLRRQHESGGERVIFAYRRNAPPGQGDYNYYAVATDSGEHLAVVRTAPLTEADLDRGRWCGVGHVAPSRDGYAFMILEILDAGSSTYLARAPYGSPGQPEQLWADGAPTSAFAENLETSYAVTGLFTTSPIEVVRVDEAGVATVVCPAGRGLPFCTVNAVVGDHVLMSADRGPGWRIAIAGPGDTTFRPLIDLPDADDRIARTDGVEIVWMHAYGPLVRGRPSNIELWASPYATEPSGIEPRFISRLNIRGPNSAIAMGNGRAWVLESTGDLDTSELVGAIYDLSTGERRVFHYPEGDYPMLAVYPGREEIAIGVLPFGSTQDARTLRFLRYEALPVEPAPEPGE